MAQRRLETMSPDDCTALLRQHHVGRLVYVDDLGPMAEPVNYAMAGPEILVRVEGGAKRLAVVQPALAFEVDEVDEDDHSGWSVIARGVAREVPIEQVAALLHQVDGPPPSPWASGIHNVWLAITPHSLTGRRLGAASSMPAY